MSADNAATNSLGLYDHWSLILNGYLGKECTHMEVTKTLDPNGDVINESETQTTIYGAISPVSEDAVREDAGTFHYGDLIAYFLAEEGVVVSEQFGPYTIIDHMIVYNDVAYSVNKLLVTAHDAGSSVVSKYVLRKGVDEWE